MAPKKSGKAGNGDKKGKKAEKVRVSLTRRCLFIITLSQGGGLKPATAINVRHILCEKQSRALEALGKIQVGVSSSPCGQRTDVLRRDSGSIKSLKTIPRTRPKVISFFLFRSPSDTQSSSSWRIAGMDDAGIDGGRVPRGRIRP